jgi:hypothetical protein
MDRVWYADVLFLFHATVQTGANQVILRAFAFVQWFTSYGGPLDSTGGQRRHVDHAFPAILNRRFPRVYLMEPELGRLYDVIPIEDILAPAPIHDDVSLVFKTGVQLADEKQLQGAERSTFLKTHRYNVPLIPSERNCNRFETCVDPSCQKLHSEQMRGADQSKTRLQVVNLLVVLMSRGCQNPPAQWTQANSINLNLGAATSAGRRVAFAAPPSPERNDEPHHEAGHSDIQDLAGSEDEAGSSALQHPGPAPQDSTRGKGGPARLAGVQAARRGVYDHSGAAVVATRTRSKRLRQGPSSDPDSETRGQGLLGPDPPSVSHSGNRRRLQQGRPRQVP